MVDLSAVGFIDDCGLATLMRALVRLRDQGGSLSFGVLAARSQIRGVGELTEPWIRLELVDLDGRLRHVVRKRLVPSAIGAEFALPAFEPPAGASAEAALEWHWDAVIEDREGEQARLREHPRPAGVLKRGLIFG